MQSPLTVPSPVTSLQLIGTRINVGETHQFVVALGMMDILFGRTLRFTKQNLSAKLILFTKHFVGA